MSKSQMRQRFALAKKPGQTFSDYYREEVRRCRAQLGEALENAAKDQNGRPVLYTICRHVSQSGMSRTISVHYFDRQAGRMLNLNYVASVLLDRPMDRLREGVICKGCGMDMGFDLAHALSCAATGHDHAFAFAWL